MLKPLQPEKIDVPRAGIDLGAAPMLQWVKVADLVVDETYQRPIGRLGARTIRKIAAEFRWSMFAPVIVSPVAGGKFAIVDGQHRTTAAILVGVESVPCQVVVATPAEQAAAFSAINGNVTRIHRMALHRAAVAAGEPTAVAIEAAATKAGVKILRYPKSELNQEPGETMAVNAIEGAIRRHGDDSVVLALRCIVETPNKVKGGLLGPRITATCDAIARLSIAQRRDDERVIRAFDNINVIREFGKASKADRQPGTTIASVLAGRLRSALLVHLTEAP